MFNNPYLEFDEHFRDGCLHESCDCFIDINGSHPLTKDFSTTILVSDLENSMANFVAKFSSQFDMIGNNLIKVERENEILYFLAKLPRNSNIKIIRPPVHKFNFPSELPLVPASIEIKEIYKQADIRYMNLLMNGSFNMSDKQWFEDNVWSDDRKVYSLKVLCMRYRSLYRYTFGRDNGRPHVISAMSNLYPRKYANAVLKQVRTVHVYPKMCQMAMDHVNEALDMLYHHLGTKEKFGNQQVKMDFCELVDIFLGSSAGINDGPVYCRELPNVKLNVSACGKKFEIFPSDVMAVIEFLSGKPELAIYFNITPKNENFFSFDKQWDDNAWFTWVEKLRTFNIPSSIFILLERLISKMRMLLERGNVIQIGHVWAHGGADSIAKKLGVFDDPDSPILVEGDVKNFDQGVLYKFMELYFSFGLVYDDVNAPYYEVRKQITTFLISSIIHRVTHLFGSVWGIQTGGVPSGCLNTSHMDSWVMALWFFFYLQLIKFIMLLMNIKKFWSLL